MSQLILVLLSIGLTSALLLATVNYMPSWQPAALDAQRQVVAGFDTLERAYRLKTRANGGVPAAPTGAEDGGLAAHFVNYYGFLPRPPGGYAWRYGYNATYNLNWFCLYPVGAGATRAVFEGMRRAATSFSAEQFYLHAGDVNACGTPAAQPEPASFPALVSVTFFVRYIPD
jgi:hypothetical protein